MVLMEIAGRRAAEVAFALWKQEPGPVAVFCGRGNNGGDGMVVARYLSFWGVPVSVFLVHAAEARAAQARVESVVNRAVLEKLGVEIQLVEAGRLQIIGEALARAAIIVDALLGTGLDRPVEGIYRDLIEEINDSGRTVLSIDLPSGINSDSGAVMGSAVRADATVTFGYLKAGLLCHPGAACSGRITVVDIGLPVIAQINTAGGNGPQWWLTTAQRIRQSLPARPDNSNKGDFGCLVTIAGSVGMGGAALLSSKTALRAGAGLSILATPRSLISQLPPQEVIYRPLKESPAGSISSKAIAELEPEIARASALVLGPGLSLQAETVNFVHEVLKIISKPCLIDADALNAVAQKKESLPREAGNFILTPHPKELSRLIGLTTGEIQANRLAAAQKAAAQFGCTIVLKGSRSIIAAPDERAFINPTGNSGMATAGSGDVLSGIIGALLAQGVEPLEAAVAGTYIHGAAGDLAAQQVGETGIVAGDITAFVPVILSKLRSGEFRGSQLELELSGSD